MRALLALLFAIVSFAPHSLAIAEEKLGRPKGEPAPSKSDAAFAAAITEAQAAYNLAVVDAHKKLRADLDRDLQAATKAADLDRAITIRDRLKRMDEEGPDVFKEGKRPGNKPRIVAGSWKMEYHPNGTTREFKVSESGVLEIFGKRVALKSYGESWLYDCGHDKLERWTFAGSRLFVEHYSPANTFPTKPNQIGLGFLAK